jgi:hypothetical protein
MTELNTNIVVWLVIAVIAIAGIVFRFLTEMSRHHTMRVLAEKGQQIPPEIFGGDAASYYRTAASFRAGIVLMCIGVAAGVFFWAMTSDSGIFRGPISGISWLPVLGVIPFMLGFALLVIALFERRLPPPPPKDNS